MNRVLRDRRVRTVAGLGAAFAMVLGVAAATGAIPGSDGTIQGCYEKATGVLRVVDSSGGCTAAETPLAWSQTGPQGETGPQGPAGLSGVERVTGATVTSNNGNNVTATATCPEGKTVLSGGYVLGGSNKDNATVQETAAVGGAETWGVKARAAGQFTLTATAVCALTS